MYRTAINLSNFNCHKKSKQRLVNKSLFLKGSSQIVTETNSLSKTKRKREREREGEGEGREGGGVTHVLSRVTASCKMEEASSIVS